MGFGSGNNKKGGPEASLCRLVGGTGRKQVESGRFSDRLVDGGRSVRRRHIHEFGLAAIGNEDLRIDEILVGWATQK
jgi:hypothetical protein